MQRLIFVIDDQMQFSYGLFEVLNFEMQFQTRAQHCKLIAESELLPIAEAD